MYDYKKFKYENSINTKLRFNVFDDIPMGKAKRIIQYP